MYAVLDEYGNHPSFLLMCNGNENEGDFTVLEDLVKKDRLMTIVIFILLLLLAIMLNLMSFMFLILRKGLDYSL